MGLFTDFLNPRQGRMEVLVCPRNWGGPGGVPMRVLGSSLAPHFMDQDTEVLRSTCRVDKD